MRNWRANYIREIKKNITIEISTVYIYIQFNYLRCRLEAFGRNIFNLNFVVW